MRDEPGTIYLLHFDRAYYHARHYIGWASDLDRRLERHDLGSGSRLVAAVLDAGIGFEVSRTWEGTRRDERRLHRRHNSPRECPLCNEGDRAPRNTSQRARGPVVRRHGSSVPSSISPPVVVGCSVGTPAPEDPRAGERIRVSAPPTAKDPELEATRAAQDTGKALNHL